MKQFTVRYPMIATLHDEVLQREVVVQADYFRIEDGILTFRRVPRFNEQFPQAVRVFARGFWAEVIEGQEVVEFKEPKGKLSHDLAGHARRMSLLDFPDRVELYSDSELGEVS